MPWLDMRRSKRPTNAFENGAALRNDMRANFVFAGIAFEEYNGQATDMDGTVRRFIAAGAEPHSQLGQMSSMK
jgi:hypothetical protein